MRRAISHPAALAQCVDFFRRRPRIRVESHYDTGGGVRSVMEGRDASLAAVASEAAARFYGARILAAAIEDHPENFTRFFLLAPPGADSGGRPEEGPGPWKTSLMFVTRNEPGALATSLVVLAAEGLNLTRIESRPIRGRPFEYRIYVDVLGSPYEKAGARALARLASTSESLTVLGCYRPAVDGPGRSL